MVRWDHKVLLVQPSKALINQTYDDLVDACGKAFPVTKIHEDTTSGTNVASAIVRHFKAADQRGQVLLITHAAFDMVPHFHRADTWDLIFDECPKVEEAFNLNVPEEHGFLTDHVELYGNGIFAPLTVNGRRSLETIVKKGGEDDVLKVFRDVAKRLMSKGWTSFAKRDHFNNILEKNGKTKTLSVYAVRNTSVMSKFKTCTVLSARFKETFFYLILSNRGVDFVEYGGRCYASMRNDPEVGFDFDQHQNGHLLEIHYLPIERFSKGIIKRYPELIDALMAYAIERFKRQEFIFQSNKMIDGKEMDTSALVAAGGKKLGGTVHGLNCYSHIDNAFIFPALNPNDNHKNFLRYLGLSNPEIDVGMHCNGIYQALMRSSLRDAKSTTKKMVIVPDKRVADWLAEVFQGATLVSIDIPLPKGIGKRGRPRQHVDATDRKRAQRERDKIRKQDSAPVEDNAFFPNMTCHENSIRGDNVTSNESIIYKMNWYEALKTTGANHVITFNTIGDVVTFMKDAHGQRYAKKEDTPLYNFTLFKNSLEEARRTVNAIGSRVLILDNDSGGLSWSDFADIFGSAKMIISNTFSSTPDREKWRAIVFLSRVVSPEEYRRLYKAILMEVEDLGYANHGFDRSGQSIVHVYYLPCQADEGESFFEGLTGDDRQLMDVDHWLEMVPHHVSSPPLVPLLIEGEDWPPEITEAVKEAVAIFDKTGTRARHGDDAISGLAKDLLKLGLPAEEAKPILDEAADRTTSPAHRRKQVERFIKGWPNG
ncbi:hypothetical protein V5F49_05875 [Xanthobacter sp. V3C-3]|uniref:hypothetical protein n=1 Tax=Xanthobacter lutulentifluminis TaxID=3119935 RepID=UPI00372AEFD7